MITAALFSPSGPADRKENPLLDLVHRSLVPSAVLIHAGSAAEGEGSDLGGEEALPGVPRGELGVSAAAMWPPLQGLGARQFLVTAGQWREHCVGQSLQWVCVFSRALSCL